MQKKLAIFLVIALVIAVANFPTVQGFTGGTGSWKRALEVRRTVSVSCFHFFFTKALTGQQVNLTAL